MRTEARKVSPPGVVRSRLRNTARGTPESWRTCGYDKPSGAFFEKHRSACVSREAQARGSVEDPASRAPFRFGVRLLLTPRARNAPRECGRLPCFLSLAPRSGERVANAAGVSRERG